MGKKPSFWQRAADFFADTSLLMTLAGRAALYALLNLCWLVCCLPVVSVGASTAALYSVLLHREGLSYDAVPGAFFRAVLKTWKTATLLWLPMLALGMLLLLDGRLLAAQGLTDNPFVLALLLLAEVVYAFTLLWLFPVLSAAGGRAAAVVKTAFLLGLRELWRSLVLMAGQVLALLLLFWCAGTSLTLVGLWVLFGFSGLARLALWVMEPVLRTLGP